MTRKSLIHGVAGDTAKEIVEVFAGCLREEELHDAFTEVYLRIKTLLRRLKIEEKRLARRSSPGTKQSGQGIAAKKNRSVEAFQVHLRRSSDGYDTDK